MVVHVAALMFAAGLAEIGGGWLVWQALRESKPAWWGIAGAVVLIVYGVVPTLQPLDDFGRLYAVYGGLFIGMSFVWGMVFDGMVVDRGDVLGSAFCAVGACIILFWPRDEMGAGAAGAEMAAPGAP